MYALLYDMWRKKILKQNVFHTFGVRAALTDFRRTMPQNDTMQLDTIRHSSTSFAMTAHYIRFPKKSSHFHRTNYYDLGRYCLLALL